MSKKDEILNKILPSSLYTLLFVITDYVLALLLIILDRFDWLRLTIISITGIIVGITAEILIIKFKTNLITYWKSIFSSIIIYVILPCPYTYKLLSASNPEVWHTQKQ